MNFDLSEDQQSMGAIFARFFDDEMSPARLRAPGSFFALPFSRA